MLKTRLMTGLATVAILAPQMAFAATPQQILDRAVRLSVEQPMPQSMVIDMNVRGNYVPSRGLSRQTIIDSGAKTTPSSFHVQAIFEGESFPRGNAMQQDGQGRIRIVKLTSTEEPAMNLENLGSLEWKTINKVFYARIADISPSVREQLRATGVDLSQLERAIGIWLKFDPNALAEFIQESLPIEISATPVTRTSVSNWEKFARLSPFLQVVRVEKKGTQGSETYTRLVVRVHPTFWTRLEQQMIKLVEEELKSLKTSSPREYIKTRAARVREIRTSLQAARIDVNKFRFVVVINDRTGRMERIEGAMQDKSPSHAYIYRGSKLVKIVQGQQTLNFQFVGTMRGIEDKTIIEPTPFVTLQDLIQRLMNMRAEATTESSAETGGMIAL